MLAQTDFAAPQYRGIHALESEYYQFMETLPDTAVPARAVAPLKKPLIPALTHSVFGYLPYWMYSYYNSLNYDLLSTVAYFSAEISANGSVINDHHWPASSLVNKAHQHGVRVLLVATLFDDSALSTLLGSAANRTRCINSLLDRVIAGNGDGVNIDFEGVPSSQRTNLVKFMQELADSFRTHIPAAHISMATPAVDWSNAWNYSALADICDALFIMGYNYYWSGSDYSGPVAPLSGGTYNVTWSVNDYLSKTDNNGAKIILGLPYYGLEWPTVSDDPHAATTGRANSRFYDTAESNAALYGKRWHTTSKTPWYAYQSGGWYQCWYDDSLSLAFKYELAKTKNLQGVGMWALGYDGSRPELWGALAEAFGGTPAPSQPTELAIRNSTKGEISIHVKASDNMDYYEIYSSPDGVNFSYKASFMTNAMTIANLAPGQPIFFKVRATNSAGNSAFTEVGAVVPGQAGVPILIVNGFDRISGTNNTFDFVRQHGSAMAAVGFGFDFAANEAVKNQIVDLQEYAMVDWISGEEGTSTSSFDPEEQGIIQNYLESGGNLFVSGSEIGYDLMGSSATQDDIAFYQNYLQADYIKDNVSVYSVTPVPGSLFDNLPDFNFDDGSHGTYDVDYPDGIKPRGTARVVLNYTGIDYAQDGCAGIVYSGLFGQSSVESKLIYWGFPFESIYPASVRDSLMSRIIRFFELEPSTSDSISIISKLILHQNYPNPFNFTKVPVTTFPITLDTTAASLGFTIRIYNLLGQEIFNRQRSDNDQDSVLFHWDGLSKSGSRASSGIYILRVSQGKVYKARKFSVIH